MRWSVLVVMMWKLTLAYADPTGHPIGTEQTTTSQHAATPPVRAYLTPSMFANTWITSIGSPDPIFLQRIAFGVAVRRSAADLRLGLTGDAALVSRFGNGALGAGIEAQCMVPAGRSLRIGPRLGAETFGGPGPRTLLTAGARMQLDEVFFVAADAYWAHAPGSPDVPAARSFGLMAGVGFEGRMGVSIVVVELALGLLAAAVVTTLPTSGD